MKIDPRVQYTGETQQPDSIKNARSTGTVSQGATKTSGVAPSTGEDTVSLSSKHSEVQALAAGVASTPEVRTERVNALKQQVQNGQYKPSGQKIADAIVSEYSRTSSKG